ncbi:uncharacterized protein BP5553_03368 [Venustampulla echinocandica]|uniref:DUF2293 domain-containing protein n=1 Tax=Venustampulla echinocandica TaxID=2656787 RepID=A0A370TU66_9HELO|nr:uncharacterized protein BP5553_03368 [Venustampulla echinocandica]RDL39028.1 hypothetical protein BP5553_03368 [Venustampulla echinocandica]
MGKRKKALAAKAQGGIALKAARRGNKEDRHARKLVVRRKQKQNITAEAWAAPAPSHLVAKLDVPKVKSKYQSYFEFAENTEKKEKRLEFQVTDNPKPPPGFAFVPIGDPILTKGCKELSRERDAMIFIVSASKEEKSKISEHIYRTGYHFRESIVEDARQIIGETVLSRPTVAPGEIEPIPETQDEINKQADAAIRDLFPRIPNTDRQMILEHAFKKGALFHGEPTVGLQTDLPLSRRVQLAVLAHIRHTHTRYDKLLRETTWVNARKVVEQVCLDVLVKWRGDEETGRDQMDEILREIVIITDSEEEDDSSSEEDSSEEDGEVTSISSAEASPAPVSRNQQRAARPENHAGEVLGRKPINGNGVDSGAVSSRTRAKVNPKIRQERRAQRGFKRYQAAWDDALHRRQNPARQSNTPHPNTPFEIIANRMPQSMGASPPREVAYRPLPGANVVYRDSSPNNRDQRHNGAHLVARPDPYYSQHISAAESHIQRNEVIVRSLPERNINQDPSLHSGTPSQPVWEQRPPQVVRGSSHRHGLQDMLVPSIETSSSDAMRPLDERRNVPDHFNQSRELYSRRMIENRRPSPPRRQVVVIDDSPPQIKRRRLVGDDSGRFRPLPSSDYSVYASAPPSDSHLLPSSSIQPRDFLVRRPAVELESSQGLSRNARSSYTAPTAQIPIYDAPGPGSLARPSEQFRRSDVLDAGQREGPIIMRHIDSASFHHNSGGDAAYRRLTAENVRDNQSVRIREDDRGFHQVGPDYHGNHTQRLRSPSLTASGRLSRTYDEGPSRPVIDQAFIHDFSQSRLDGPVRATNGSNVLPARSHQEFEGQGNRSRGYEDHPARSFATLPPARARSPAGYLQRPISRHDREETGRPIVYENPRSPAQMNYAPVEQPPILVRQGIMRPQAGVAPSHARVPRRELVILE